MYFMLLYTVVHHYHLLLLRWTFSGDRKTVCSVCSLKVMELSRHTWKHTEQLEDAGCKSDKEKDGVGGKNMIKGNSGGATGRGLLPLFILTVGDIGDTHSFY